MDSVQFKLVYTQDEKELKKVRDTIAEIKKELQSVEVKMLDTKSLSPILNAQKKILDNEKNISSIKKEKETQNKKELAFLQQQKTLFDIYEKAQQKGAKDTQRAINSAIKNEELLTKKQMARIKLSYSEEIYMINNVQKLIKHKFANEKQLYAERKQYESWWITSLKERDVKEKALRDNKAKEEADLARNYTTWWKLSLDKKEEIIKDHRQKEIEYNKVWKQAESDKIKEIKQRFANLSQIEKEKKKRLAEEKLAEQHILAMNKEKEAITRKQLAQEKKLENQRKAEASLNDKLKAQKIQFINFERKLNGYSDDNLKDLKQTINLNRLLTREQKAQMATIKDMANIQQRQSREGSAVGSFLGLNYLTGTVRRMYSELETLDESFYNLGVVSGKSVYEIEKMKDVYFDLGNIIPRSTKELADSANIISRTGMSYGEAFDTMTSSAQLASASGENLAFTSELLAKQLVAFKLSGEDARDTIDAIHSVALQTPTSLKGINDTLKSSASAFGALISFTQKSGDELTEYKKDLVDLNLAMTGSLAQIGLKASTSGIVIRNFMSRILSTEKSAVKMFNSLDLSFDSSNQNLNTFNSNFEKLSYLAKTDVYQALDVLSNNIDALTKTSTDGGNAMKKMFTDRQWTPILNILRQIETIGSSKSFVEMMTEGKSVADDLDKQMSSLSSQMKIFRNNITRSYTAMSGVVKDFGELGLTILNPLTKASNEFMDTTIGKAVSLTASLGAISLALGNMTELFRRMRFFENMAFFSLANPMSLAIAGALVAIGTAYSVYKDMERKQEAITVATRRQLESVEKIKKEELIRKANLTSIKNEHEASISYLDRQYEILLNTNSIQEENLGVIKRQISELETATKFIDMIGSYERAKIDFSKSSIDTSGLIEAKKSLDDINNLRISMGETKLISTTARKELQLQGISQKQYSDSLREELLTHEGIVKTTNQLLPLLDKESKFRKDILNIQQKAQDELRKGDLGYTSTTDLSFYSLIKNNILEVITAHEKMGQIAGTEQAKIDDMIKEYQNKLKDMAGELENVIVEQEKFKNQLRDTRFSDFIKNEDIKNMGDFANKYSEIFKVDATSAGELFKQTFEGLQPEKYKDVMLQMLKAQSEINEYTDILKIVDKDSDEFKRYSVALNNWLDILNEYKNRVNDTNDATKKYSITIKNLTESYSSAMKEFEESGKKGYALFDAKRATLLEKEAQSIRNYNQAMAKAGQSGVEFSSVDALKTRFEELSAMKSKFDEDSRVSGGKIDDVTKIESDTYKNITNEMTAINKLLTTIFGIKKDTEKLDSDQESYTKSVEETTRKIHQIGMSNLDVSKAEMKYARDEYNLRISSGKYSEKEIADSEYAKKLAEEKYSLTLKEHTLFKNQLKIRKENIGEDSVDIAKNNLQLLRNKIALEEDSNKKKELELALDEATYDYSVAKEKKENQLLELRIKGNSVGGSSVKNAYDVLRLVRERVVNEKDEVEVAQQNYDLKVAQYDLDRAIKAENKQILDLRKSRSQLGMSELSIAEQHLKHLKGRKDGFSSILEYEQHLYDLQKAQLTVEEKRNAVRKEYATTVWSSVMDFATGKGVSAPSYDVNAFVEAGMKLQKGGLTTGEKTSNQMTMGAQALNMATSIYASQLTKANEMQVSAINSEISALELRKQLAKTDSERLEIERQLVEKQIQLSNSRASQASSQALMGGVTGGITSGLTIAATGGFNPLSIAMGALVGGMSIFSGSEQAQQAERQAREQANMLREQQATTEAVQAQNKYTETSNDLLKDIADNSTTLGVESALDRAVESMVKQQGDFGGVASIGWTEVTSSYNVFSGKKKHRSSRTQTANVNLATLGYTLDDLDTKDEILMVESEINNKIRERQSLLTGIDLASRDKERYNAGKAREAQLLAEIEAYQRMGEQVSTIIKSVGGMKLITTETRLGATIKEILAKDGKTITGFEADWTDFMKETITNASEIGNDVGKTFGETFSTGLNKTIATAVYDKQTQDRLENRMSDLGKTLSNTIAIGGSYQQYANTAVGILNEQKVLQEKINQETFRFNQYWIEAGGNISDIKTQLTGFGESLYDSLYSSFDILDDTERFNSIGNTIGSSIIAGIKESQIDNYLSGDILRITETMNNMLTSGKYDTQTIYSLAQEANRLTAQTSAVTSQISSIGDLFKGDVTYRAESSDIQYQTATTSNITYSTTFTNQFDIGNLIGSEEGLREFASTLKPILDDISSDFPNR